MKKLATLFFMFHLTGQMGLNAQGGNGTVLPPAMNMYFMENQEGKLNAMPGAQYDLLVSYWDELGLRGQEEFQGVLGPGSNLTFTMTQGSNQNPVDFANQEGFWELMQKVSLHGMITDGSGTREFDQEYPLHEMIRVIQSRSTEAIYNYPYRNDSWFTVEHLINPMPGMRNDLAIFKESTDGLNPNAIGRLNLDEVYDIVNLPSAFDNSNVPTLVIHPFDPPLGKCFGGQRPTKESLIEVFGGQEAAGVYNVFGVVAEGGIFDGFTGDGVETRTEPHPMAAIFGDNSLNEMGTGVFGKGETTGVYGQGKNGTIGVTTGDQNGSAATAFVGAAPAAGGFKYGIYANSNSQPSTWAAGIFGSGFYTGSWMMSSDEKLKTHITPQADALNKIMELKPATYKYRSGTPYSFTDKIHHGFLAQDVEAIFPELVENIKMPADPTPEKMASSPVQEFKGIDYTGMISILTGAIQELNTTLTAKIAAQEAEIEALRKLIQR